jgi:hypothetical protein
MWNNVKVIVNRDMPWQSTSYTLAADMAEYPYGISEHFSADDRARLEATQVPLGHGRTRTVADLIVGYAAHVNSSLPSATCSRARTATRGTPTTMSPR